MKFKKNIGLPLILISVFLGLILAFSVIQTKDTTDLHHLKSELNAAQEKLKALEERNQLLEDAVTNPIKAYGNETREELKKQGLNDNLILQTDERWASLPYGWGIYSTFDKNACAIASLSMINANYQKGDLSVQNVLDWAKNDYFTDDGTSWNIFPAFAQHYGYTYTDLGDNIEDALPYLNQGIPVVASVKPGIFTSVGHILVLSSANDQGIHLLDPNDDAKKRHSLTTYSNEQIQNELAHLWVYKPE
ncbi:C39 family peptidase [Streptococcaceae bacterium ESL0687]|nr:C39 family peptidase [Streptococcaceae bacterium ESL0687]